ncbi:MAG: hypothetical protein QM702_05595, partial [Rubrivivax sp.]
RIPRLIGKHDRIRTAPARAFLKRKPLAAYCDKVVMPAFDLAHQDFERQLISPQQQAAAQRVILQVLAELTRSPLPARRRAAVLDGSGLGLRLRRERESVEGRWQGPLDVPPGSLMLCVSLPDPGAELSAELLVRACEASASTPATRRLASWPRCRRTRAPTPSAWSSSSAAAKSRPQDRAALDACLAMLPQARVVAMLPALLSAQAPQDPLPSERHHHTAYSFEEALSLVQRRPV